LFFLEGRKKIFVVNERLRAEKEYTFGKKKFRLHNITGGFGISTGGWGHRPLLADKGDYWRIVCFSYWRILFVTDGILNDSITGGLLCITGGLFNSL
jgi:hypothetical protein